MKHSAYSPTEGHPLLGEACLQTFHFFLGAQAPLHGWLQYLDVQNFDAHKIFDDIPKGSLETQPLKIDIAFYSYRCGGMATGRTCPSDESERLQISGTRLREMFSNKETVPTEFSRPEVVKVLQKYYDSLSH